MNISEDIKTRTFGVEIEMCNFDRTKISLPNGFVWDEEEKINNTDSFIDKRYGGEVNSPPMLYNKESMSILREVLNQMLDAGGKIIWNIDIHVHIYSGDLELDSLKSLISFEYYCYPYFKKYCQFQDWNELCPTSKPLITEQKYLEIKKAKSIQDLKQLLTNNSKKGFIRYAINTASTFVYKTVEFRCFKGTVNFEEMKNCIEATYAMFYYAINHKEEDFLRISSYDEFIEIIGLPINVPKAKIPLIFQGNPYKLKETYKAKPIGYNSKQASALLEAVKNHGHKELCIVNGFMYYYELFFQDKVKISIYCQDPYCYLLYLIANGKMSLTYKNKLSWLEDYNDNTPSRQMALALYAEKLQKILMSKSSRNDALVESLKFRAKESIEKTEKACEKLISMLTTCDFHVGTLQDAIADKSVIFFNYGDNKSQKRTFKLIQENSDLELEFELKRNDYYELIETLPQNTYFYYLSDSPYLSNMHKLSMFNSSNGERWSAGRFLYCNKPSNVNQVSTSYKSNLIEVNEIVPPDDLVIDNPDKLVISRVSPDFLHCLQKKYIKKVDMVSKCTYAFVVMYDKYTLGGFGFTLPQHKGYDLFQLTDFCTNNGIPRLSKLILYCIQSKGVQKELSRRMHKLCVNVISCAYTHKPVSMKYRGVYTKVKEHCTSSYLAYEGKLGIYDSNKSVIEKYQKTLKNGK